MAKKQKDKMEGKESRNKVTKKSNILENRRDKTTWEDGIKIPNKIRTKESCRTARKRSRNQGSEQVREK